MHGRVLDAETGRPVSRRTSYLHFFCDGIDVQKTLDPADETTFDVSMPAPRVRIRLADRSDEYELFERTVTVDGRSLAYDIRLVPTHYVLLRGQAIDAATGKPLLPAHGPLLYFEGAGWGRSLVRLDDDGSFTLRVPRAKLTIRAVDTPKRIANPTLDLTGYEGDERAFELRFE